MSINALFPTLAATLGAAVLAALSTPAAGAGSPHQVDPALMQPTLNPAFAPWACWRAGGGIICQGDMAQTWSEPLGLSCGGVEVHTTGSGRERMTRWHTGDGLATRTAVHLDYTELFTLGDEAGAPSVQARAHWNRLYTYGVAGELASRVLTETGNNWVWVGADGVVLRDVGRVEFAPGADFETITSMNGVHDYYEDPEAFDQTLCDALT